MTFKTKVIAGFGAALAILILVGILSYRSIVQNGEDRAWVTHTHLVLEKLDAVQINLLDAETGMRGYILTGDTSFLGPYDDALDHVHQNVRELRDLTADNPVELQSLNRLDPLIANLLRLAQDRIDTRTRAGLALGAEAVRAGSGKAEMDQIRERLSEMIMEENRLRSLRLEEANRSSQIVKIVILTGEVLAIVFLSLAGIVVGQEMGERRRAEGKVRKLNAELERRVAERTAELNERAKELARSNSELQQFAYVASHDLQEPLRMVASFTQLLAKRYGDKLDDDAREFIHYAVDGATRMQTLISDLLSYSRVGTQGRPLVPTDCEALIAKILGDLKFAIMESGAVVTHDPLPVVLADPQQLGQLLQNLLTNAIKFHGKEIPRIHFTAERCGNDWKISVRDNGIGISSEHFDRIFVIFQRLHTKTEYPGTGIGLAICKKIVERHGGRIWIEPSPGGGATFCFTIPVSGSNTTGGGEPNELRIAAYAN
jgi:signal transduction histidine kinase